MMQFSFHVLIIRFVLLRQIAQAGTGDLSLWNLMSAHLISVITNIQNLSMISEFKIDVNSLDAILPLIQRLIYDNGPEALAKR